VHQNGASSSFGIIKCGVPQGSIMGPLLFCLFINDLPLTLNNPKVLCDLFADDNSLHSSGKNVLEIQQTLQDGLNDVQNWCKHNKMLLNPTKSKSMIMTSRQKHQRQPLALKLTVNSATINQVTDHKVLGVIVDEDLSWKGHINHLDKIL
jgi:hypothetical protein